MKRTTKGLLWLLLILLIAIPGTIITKFGYTKMLEYGTVALYNNTFFGILKYIVFSLMHLLVSCIGAGFIITALVFGAYVIREYILPKNVEETEDQENEDEYKEV